MQADLDAQLIDAVQGGTGTDVRRLVRFGANPNARKLVTLEALVDTDGYGNTVWETDAVKCGSALVLAIMRGDPEVVRALLVCKASNWCFGTSAWPAREWRESRWDSTREFPNPLCLACHGCPHGKEDLVDCRDQECSRKWLAAGEEPRGRRGHAEAVGDEHLRSPFTPESLKLNRIQSGDEEAANCRDESSVPKIECDGTVDLLRKFSDQKGNNTHTLDVEDQAEVDVPTIMPTAIVVRGQDKLSGVWCCTGGVKYKGSGVG
ncbi:hypothetical protein M427DRAFT_43770 [Gonapodya prolifera JEL478]|uniref:Ankyrin n=1 Tax=Gonapodya prolifera (strain JEL478) TaxID=1344416 RepID=A0A139AHN8_GONPJ|nr:hypothetical protein M427DRAFT_43770 [Gonapodya prolifera JEL478]|eukprot:KXS16342.1 hypothetical protein M427DRAFT_43770 [Gonapodya prolifera JEL478]